MAKIQIGALERLMRIQKARHEGSEQLQQQTAAIAQELLGEEVTREDAAVRSHAYPDSGYMTPYEATIAFAVQLHRAISWHATNVARKPPELSKYHPDSSLPAMFKDVWKARQLCDQVSMPYSFFAQQAVMYWESLKRNRLPRPTQLCSPEVMVHVATLWADPSVRLRHPLPTAASDARFDPQNYTAGPVQEAVLTIIDERVEFAKRVGVPPENIVAEALNSNITEAEARRRYGDDLTTSALAIRTRQQSSLDVLVSDHA